MIERIQRKRTKGWKMPENTVYVGRPTIWGNVYRAGTFKGMTAADAVEMFKKRLEENIYPDAVHINRCIELLRGKNLACWCKVGDPCHADVLLEIANKEPA